MTTSSLWSGRYFETFFVSFIISAALMPVAIYFLKKFNILDIPNQRKVHTSPVPRMGGIVIYIAFVVPMIMLMYFSNPQKGIILGSGLALLVGAADDIWGIPAYWKLIALFGLILLIGFYGVHTSLPFHMIGLNDRIMNTLATMLWIAGICSAINALDHLDALAGGVSVIAAIMYFIVSITSGQKFWGLMSVALLGSLLGFLIYNKHPAKIFMGDSGSFFLGFSLASIGIMGGWSSNPIKSMIVPVAVLSVPIFDLAYVIISRRFNGTTRSIRESIAYCGKDHIGHRMMDMGLGSVDAVRVVYLIAATVSISAITIRLTNFLESLLLLLQIFMIYTILIIIMHFAGQKIKRLEQ